MTLSDTGLNDRSAPSLNSIEVGLFSHFSYKIISNEKF